MRQNNYRKKKEIRKKIFYHCRFFEEPRTCHQVVDNSMGVRFTKERLCSMANFETVAIKNDRKMNKRIVISIQKMQDELRHGRFCF